MAKIIGEGSLDSKVVKLQGFEKFIDYHTLAVMKRALELGQTFPSVDVVKFSEDNYRLLHGVVDGPITGQYGGHHRSRIYSDSGLVLPVRVCDGHNNLVLDGGCQWRDIQNVPVRNVLSLDWRGVLPPRLLVALSFLPEDERELFCEQNSLDDVSLNTTSLVYFGQLSYKDTINSLIQKRTKW